MMPAGTYYIGDLCYVMHDEWDEFCYLTIKYETCLDGEFSLKDGRRFATYQTMYGDGTYRASNGANLGVDAGLIGCIRLDDIDQSNPDNDISLGTIVHFDREFDTSESEGVIRFGYIKIDTSDDDSDEDDSDEDDSDEDDSEGVAG